jgi:hypothetical protein
VTFQLLGQPGLQPFHNPCRGNGRRGDDKQAIAAILPLARIPDTAQGGPCHLIDRLPDDPPVLVIASVCAEGRHVGADDGAILAAQHRSARSCSFRAETVTRPLRERPARLILFTSG